MAEDLLVSITGVGYEGGIVHFTFSIIDNQITGRAHKQNITLKHKDLSLDKIKEVLREKELERLKDPDREIGIKLADQYLEKKFTLSLEDKE